MSYIYISYRCILLIHYLCIFNIYTIYGSSKYSYIYMNLYIYGSSKYSYIYIYVVDVDFYRFIMNIINKTTPLDCHIIIILVNKYEACITGK